MKKISEIYCHEINFDSTSERSLKNCCEQFILNLEKDYDNFLEILNQETKKFEEVFPNSKSGNLFDLNSNFVYIPEKVSSRSPMTIIDGGWGVGKTYFLEKLFEFISKKKIKLSKIKKGLIIDVWKLSSSNDIQEVFIFELFSNFFKNQNSENKLIKICRSFYNHFFSSLIDKIIGSDLPKSEKKELTKNECIEKLNNEINEPTLVIVDNIERLGNDALEIIKVIQKLTILNNFIFLLPINKNTLDFTNDTKSCGWAIEKYINLPFYKLTQNYVGIFMSFGFNKEISEILNHVIHVVDKSSEFIKIPTIREMEKMIRHNINFLKEKFDISKYSLIINFVRKFGIVNQESLMKEIINNDMKIVDDYFNQYEENLSKMDDLWVENPNFSSKDKYSIYLLLFQNIKNKIDSYSRKSCLDEINNFFYLTNMKFIYEKDYLNSLEEKNSFIINKLVELDNWLFSNQNYFRDYFQVSMCMQHIKNINSIQVKLINNVNNIKKSLFKFLNKEHINDYYYEYSIINNIEKRNIDINTNFWKIHKNRLIEFIINNPDSIAKKSK